MIRLLTILLGTLLLAACSPKAAAPATSSTMPTYTPQPYSSIVHPDWAKDAVIYQINTRQFTPEGTFNAAKAQLPRLKALGVDVLWLMPIHPIGEQNRKGSLGSPYSVKDYRAVNPEFGTLDDFKSFVDAAHAAGFKVIIDWVANHSSWDNALVAAHPDWYEKDWKGAFHPTPWTDWSDIIDFNYDAPGLRQYMTEAMVYWVKDIGIDGYRCDVAGFVPMDFWDEVRRQLDAVKPVFMLAEWDTPDMHRAAFDATYAWDWKDAARDIAQGKSDASRMTGQLQHHLGAWPADGLRMYYTENHDQNAWEGTPREFYGDALQTMMTLQFLMDGVQVIHNGQEAGNEKRLAFFEKDPIAWRDHPHTELIRQLIAMKTANPALHNGLAGGPYAPVMTDNPSQILSFARTESGNTVVALFNLTNRPARFKLADGPVAGTWNDALGGAPATLALGDTVELPAWGNRVLTRTLPAN
jgi:1,4-alpha-glucan branching enzyme